MLAGGKNWMKKGGKRDGKDITLISSEVLQFGKKREVKQMIRWVTFPSFFYLKGF